MAVKNLTQWLPPSGTGYVTQGSNNNLVTNSGVFLTDNLGNLLVTNTTTVTGKNTDVWTKTTKGTAGWVNKTVTVGSAYSLADPSSNLLVDPAGNQIVDTGDTLSGKNTTTWTVSGV